MAVSRRLRFEILRRDAHTCRYCGGAAPDVRLTVDHVIPVALGGGDDPTNLVTACTDCNAGKSSTPPDAQIVADVDAAAFLFAQAIEKAAEIRRRKLGRVTGAIETFRDRWEGMLGGTDQLPRDWPVSVDRFLSAGLDADDLNRFLDVVHDRGIGPAHRWRYFCGCCWREIGERQELARRMIEDGQV